MRGPLSRVAALAVMVGCGARTGLLPEGSHVTASDGGPVTGDEGDEDDDGGPSAGASWSDSALGGEGGEDAGSLAPGVTCSLGTSGVQGGRDIPCEVETTETCSDGVTYDVTCTCRSATCKCSQSSGQGGSSGGSAPFIGCAAICSASSIDLAYESCGFPHE